MPLITDTEACVPSSTNTRTFSAPSVQFSQPGPGFAQFVQPAAGSFGQPVGFAQPPPFAGGPAGPPPIGTAFRAAGSPNEAVFKPVSGGGQSARPSVLECKLNYFYKFLLDPYIRLQIAMISRHPSVSTLGRTLFYIIKRRPLSIKVLCTIKPIFSLQWLLSQSFLPSAIFSVDLCLKNSCPRSAFIKLNSNGFLSTVKLLI